MSDVYNEIEYNGIKTIPIIELAKIKYPGINFKLIDMDGELVCVGVLDNFNVIIFSLHGTFGTYKIYKKRINGIGYEFYKYGIGIKRKEIRERLIE